MCGRYTQTKKPEDIKKLVDFSGDESLLSFRYNVAPTQSAPVVVATRALRSLRWGLVPSWAEREAVGSRMINARSETLREKPAFKNLLEQRRCGVLADGFFEWRRSGRTRQPFLFRLKAQAAFAFAGLWDVWRAADGHELETFTILTTAANELVRPIHDRMPVMLTAAGLTAWLEKGQREPVLRELAAPFPAGLMESFAVTPAVNSPLFESPVCVQPAESPPEPMEFDFGG